MTVAECARRATSMMLDAGWQLEDARRDVAVLARHLLGWDAAAWLTGQRDPVSDAVAHELDRLVARRARGEPVAYLTGDREFYGRPFRVSPAVLIPRPETEMLVERALAAIDARRDGNISVVDVGTGSGCIAVTIALERPAAQVLATDVSRDALEVARANAARLGAVQRVRFTHDTLTGPADAVDVIVSNPPYIAERDREFVMRDVRDFEPSGALFAGIDGLDVIRKLINRAAVALRPGGSLLMEIGAGQAAAVLELMERAGFEDLRTTSDLAGIARVVEGTREAAPV
jgi:release factor glutamine methyltransferase